MEKFFDKLKGVFGRVKGAFKKAKALEKAFERTGGVRIDSDVILGYKIIGHEGPFYQIQISFKPDATGAKDPQAKNYGGKKPVYVTASMLQIVKLQQGGMAYYLDT